MREAQRFLRYVIPGLIFIIELLTYLLLARDLDMLLRQCLNSGIITLRDMTWLRFTFRVIESAIKTFGFKRFTSFLN